MGPRPPGHPRPPGAWEGPSVGGPGGPVLGHTQGVTGYRPPRGGRQEGGETLSVSGLVTYGGLHLPFFPGSEGICFWHLGAALICQEKGEADLIHVAFLEAPLVPLLWGGSPRGRSGPWGRGRGAVRGAPVCSGQQAGSLREPGGCVPPSPPFYRRGRERTEERSDFLRVTQKKGLAQHLKRGGLQPWGEQREEGTRDPHVQRWFSPWNWLPASRALHPRSLGTGVRYRHNTPRLLLLCRPRGAGAPGSHPATPHPCGKPSPRTSSGPDPVLGPSWEQGWVPCPRPRRNSQSEGGGGHITRKRWPGQISPRHRNRADHGVTREGSLEEGRHSPPRPAWERLEPKPGPGPASAPLLWQGRCLCLPGPLFLRLSHRLGHHAGARGQEPALQPVFSCHSGKAAGGRGKGGQPSPHPLWHPPSSSALEVGVSAVGLGPRLTPSAHDTRQTRGR